jgi:hypothetical protein
MVVVYPDGPVLPGPIAHVAFVHVRTATLA